MNWEAWVALTTIVAVLYALGRNIAGQDVVLMGGALVLTSFSLVSDKFPGVGDLAASFGNEGMLTVGVLFVVAAGLSETGAMSRLVEPFLGRPSTVRGAQVRLMLPVMGISAFLNNTPVVAMFIPVVHDWCKRTGLSPSKLFIPLSYAAILGGVCTLIGTSTNLVVQGLMIQAQKTDPTMPVMGMFTLTWVGVPVALLGAATMLLLSGRLLPNRTAFGPRSTDPREYTVEMLVQPGSAIEGQTIEKAGLRHLPRMFLASIERNGQALVAVEPDEILRSGDRLVFVGIVDSVVDLNKIRGLVPATDQVYKLDVPRHNRCLIEAVVSDTCPVVGKSVREARFRSRYDAVLIAVHRNGERIAQKIGDIVLKAGDALLLETHPRFVKKHRYSKDFFLIAPVADSQPARHDRAGVALAILAGMVIIASSEDLFGVSVFHAALLAAALMGLTRCVSAERGRRSIDFAVLVAIAAALTIGAGMRTTGLAQTSANLIIEAARPLGAWGVLAAVYGITLVFTELVTNNAAAALAFPIARATASGLGVDFMPFAVAIAVAASAGFATPLGYQTHMMVYGPGGYRFQDFVRIGIPLDLVVMAATVALTPLFFPF